jgi:hypothetical protein
MSTGFKVVLALGIILGACAVIWLSGLHVGQRRAPRNAVMKHEVMLLQDALFAFKEHFGMFPPDGTNPQAVAVFWAKAFPKATVGPPTIHPETALYYWLNGPNGPNGPVGFSSNTHNPLDNNTHRMEPFFTFDTGRVKANNGGYSYYPDNRLTSVSLTPTSTNGAPYVYLAAVNGSYTSSYSLTYQFSNQKTSVSVRPYMDARVSSSTPVNPTTFQILCPGLDGQYAADAGTQYPTGPYGEYQSDDITNFTKGSTLDDDTPE